MSGCEYYQELISRMLDEELSGEESAVLAEHLTRIALPLAPQGADAPAPAPGVAISSLVV